MSSFKSKMRKLKKEPKTIILSYLNTLDQLQLILSFQQFHHLSVTYQQFEYNYILKLDKYFKTMKYVHSLTSRILTQDLVCSIKNYYQRQGCCLSLGLVQNLVLIYFQFLVDSNEVSSLDMLDKLFKSCQCMILKHIQSTDCLNNSNRIFDVFDLSNYLILYTKNVSLSYFYPNDESDELLKTISFKTKNLINEYDKGFYIKELNFNDSFMKYKNIQSFLAEMTKENSPKITKLTLRTSNLTLEIDDIFEIFSKIFQYNTIDVVDIDISHLSDVFILENIIKMWSIADKEFNLTISSECLNEINSKIDKEIIMRIGKIYINTRIQANQECAIVLDLSLFLNLHSLTLNINDLSFISKVVMIREASISKLRRLKVFSYYTESYNNYDLEVFINDLLSIPFTRLLDFSFVAFNNNPLYIEIDQCLYLNLPYSLQSIEIILKIVNSYYVDIYLISHLLQSHQRSIHLTNLKISPVLFNLLTTLISQSSNEFYIDSIDSLSFPTSDQIEGIVVERDITIDSICIYYDKDVVNTPHESYFRLFKTTTYLTINILFKDTFGDSFITNILSSTVSQCFSIRKLVFNLKKERKSNVCLFKSVLLLLKKLFFSLEKVISQVKVFEINIFNPGFISVSSIKNKGFSVVGIEEKDYSELIELINLYDKHLVNCIQSNVIDFDNDDNGLLLLD